MNFKRRCPKGSTCNFLHVFRNPNRTFENLNLTSERREELSEIDVMESARNWRWSVSPEKETQSEIKNGYHKRKRSPNNYRHKKNRSHHESARSYSSRSSAYDRKHKYSKSRSSRKKSSKHRDKNEIT